VTLTGSTKAGSAVAQIAGKHIKKSVLELGGNNALVVFDDADINQSVDICVNARFQNTGQSCIAGKRLLIHHKIYKQFVALLIDKIKKLKIGDPRENDTYISVLAREDLAQHLKHQLDISIDLGAKLLFGGNQQGTYFQPTLIESTSLDVPVFKEETFGPLLAIHSFETEDEAIQIINQSEYGLGASIFTKDRERFQNMCWQIEDGAVVMNDMLKSHPKLPFGGTKRSGYGRELGKEGILEFANIKTIVIHST
jgi:succinate-semialdehyde dehydrogenase/glutarate-semialdehyde dehydrogenase